MGKPRPRITRKGGKTYAYTPKKYQDCETKIAYEYERQGGEFFGAGELAVNIIICRKQPKGTPKKYYEIEDTVRPDIDNIAKSVLDALNGVAYTDDCQVTSLKVDKQPRRKIEYECIFVSVSAVKTHGIRRKIWNKIKSFYCQMVERQKDYERFTLED